MCVMHKLLYLKDCVRYACTILVVSDGLCSLCINHPRRISEASTWCYHYYFEHQDEMQASASDHGITPVPTRIYLCNNI